MKWTFNIKISFPTMFSLRLDTFPVFFRVPTIQAVNRFYDCLTQLQLEKIHKIENFGANCSKSLVAHLSCWE
jgi:hypothetical protein